MSSQVFCKRCGKNAVKNCLTCEKCNSSFHQSCARLWKGLKVTSDCTINCCTDDTNDPITEQFCDAMENVSANGKIDIAIFIYIIKQKDDLVRELQDKNRMLNEHISLLNKLRAAEESKTVQSSKDKNGVKTSSDDKVFNSDIYSNEHTNTGRNNVPTVQNDKVLNKQRNHKSGSVGISNSDVTTAVLEAQTKQRIDKYININGDINNKHDNKIAGQEWKVASNRKRRRPTLIGKNKDSAVIKGVPRWVDLHVYRLEPSTTVTSISDMLRVHIPEVKCEALVSKHPGLYASFKVSVLEDNFKTAMDADIWPYGTCINRFFHKRRINQSVTT
uniref:Uncharacterized protein n=1 Tax=Anoplophora glabripennis TaxID=217634 RepID=V5GZG9_ANOGL